MTYSALDIVSQYIKLRDYVKARTKEFKEGGPTENDQELIARLRAAEKADDATDFLTTVDCREIADRLEQLLTPIKAYDEAMEALEGLAGAMLDETKQKALNTEAGTAFKKRGLSVTCEDHEAFLNWVWQFNARHFLTSHVSKEQVEIYLDGPGNGHPPPGIKVTPYVEIQFRKL